MTGVTDFDVSSSMFVMALGVLAGSMVISRVIKGARRQIARLLTESKAFPVIVPEMRMDGCIDA